MKNTAKLDPSFCINFFLLIFFLSSCSIAPLFEEKSSPFTAIITNHRGSKGVTKFYWPKKLLYREQENCPGHWPFSEGIIRDALDEWGNAQSIILLGADANNSAGHHIFHHVVLVGKILFKENQRERTIFIARQEGDHQELLPEEVSLIKHFWSNLYEEREVLSVVTQGVNLNDELQKRIVGKSEWERIRRSCMALYDVLEKDKKIQNFKGKELSYFTCRRYIDEERKGITREDRQYHFFLDSLLHLSTYGRVYNCKEENFFNSSGDFERMKQKDFFSLVLYPHLCKGGFPYRKIEEKIKRELYILWRRNKETLFWQDNFSTLGGLSLRLKKTVKRRKNEYRCRKKDVDFKRK